MTAEESVKAGRLEDALADLQARVRKAPSDARLRVFLFQLLAVMGQWDRALTQLKVASDIDPSTVAMFKTYQEALRCEVLRGEIFAGRKTPLLFGEPSEWAALLVQAVKLTADGKFEEAGQLREKAFEAAPTTSGKINGQPFAWIADADTRLGPMLEAVINGRYFWMPFSRLREVKVEKPADLRDVAWTPATLSLSNGGETVALIPTRYLGSEASTDSRVVMGRSTEWQEHPGSTFIGLGQRQFATDQGEFALMDVRTIELDAEAGAGQPDAGAGTGKPEGVA